MRVRGFGLFERTGHFILPLKAWGTGSNFTGNPTGLIGQLVPYLCVGAYDRWLDAMLGKLFFRIYSRD
jgi:hypothetical protein